MSGGISQILRQYPNTTVLFVITGVGPENAKETAKIIIQYLKPWAVINLGTCGLNSKGPKWQPGDTIFPAFTLGPEGHHIRCLKYLPFPSPSNLIRVKEVQSLPRSLLCRDSTYSSFVDMEAWFQHTIFAEHGLPFCCLKVITDNCSSTTPADYKKRLGKVVWQVKKLLGFLEPPSSPPDVSVIIPVHNRAWSIKRAIDSALCQSLPPCELIVVDDGSTDRTADILKSYGDRIVSISLGRPQGVSAARNIGVEASRGKWLSFLDSDDKWDKDKLLHHARFMERYPFLEIFQCDEIWIRKGKRVNKRRYHEKKAGWIWNPCLERCMVSPSCSVVQRDLLKKYGLFDARIPACEDYDLWLRISRHHPIGLDRHQDVIRYGGHSDQLSMRYPAMDRFRVFSLIKALGEEDDPLFYQRIEVEIQKRLSILETGAIKRGRLGHAAMYRQAMKQVKRKVLDERQYLFLLAGQPRRLQALASDRST